jgi:hypothetical protein
MATDLRNDIRAFRDFLDEKLSQGDMNLTLDEALGLWALQTHPGQRSRTEARRTDDRSGAPRVAASSRARAELLDEVQPTCRVIRGSRWLD